jgi:hypothetical protein
VDKGLHQFLKEDLKGDLKDDDAILDTVATKITRRGLGVAAIFFLESSKPLSFLGSQVLVFFEPFVKTFFEVKNYERFCLLLENRENVEKLIQKIEDQEEKLSEEKREEKRVKKEQKREKTREKKEHEHSKS